MPLAFVLLNVEPGKEEKVLEELRSIPEIKEAHRVYGVYDTLIKIEADSQEKLKDIITWRIRRIPNVRSTLTMLAIE
ncbi:MAG: Lrp/AsnC ligand binding domain-containing protein [Nitrososphaeria archaeon]|jgi:DNA-binding Lrp family transcriptional regulator|nr:Lrp/AsnC ligand binding domain-containing protein [Nitrososphaerota archaeon]